MMPWTMPVAKATCCQLFVQENSESRVSRYIQRYREKRTVVSRDAIGLYTEVERIRTHCSRHKENPKWGLDLSEGKMTAVSWGQTGAVMDRRMKRYLFQNGLVKKECFRRFTTRHCREATPGALC